MSNAHRVFSWVALCVFTLVPVVSLAATETILANYTFEGAPCSNMSWTTVSNSGYPNPAALFPGAAVVQESTPNLTCLWGFFSGSTATYACGGFPLQAAVPYMNMLGQYVDNEIRSPLIPWGPGGTDALLVDFDVYEDLPLDNLVFYTWKVRYIDGGIPSAWFSDGDFKFGATKAWKTLRTDPFIVPSTADFVQVALGCVDKCADWCGTIGTGACHSHSPLFDNVKVIRSALAPEITSISDVGNDQGRQVRIRWERGPSDAPMSPFPVVQYGVYRRQDLFLTSSTPAHVAALARPDFRSPTIVGWDFVAAIPARGDLEYQAVVPTLCDSTLTAGQCWSVFFVSAMTATPTLFFDSPHDSGYSVDNLIPAPPSGLIVAYNQPGGNELAWDESTAPDFAYFNVYRETLAGRAPAAGTLVHSTIETGWVDPTGVPGHHYSVTAVDASGNESDPSTPEATTGIGDTPRPGFALHHALPNPFRGTTTIRYSVPSTGGRVSIAIYDTAGRLVARLRDGLDAAGDRSTTWNGSDQAGRRVASGVYFCRMTAPGFAMTRKLVVLR